MPKPPVELQYVLFLLAFFASGVVHSIIYYPEINFRDAFLGGVGTSLLVFIAAFITMIIMNMISVWTGKGNHLLISSLGFVVGGLMVFFILKPIIPVFTGMVLVLFVIHVKFGSE